ncbi:hypothetical protein [Aeromonas molluscorum]|uniref:hypothetical protein n=1 Tax=Aeromonas molluscorum TaxID=271417 RepID=UPI003F1C1F95
MKFIPFDDVSAEDFLPLLNDETLRKHLIDHPIFDAAGVRAWMEEKRRIDALPGCRVRAVLIDGALVGWCGLQPDEEGVEIAIVIASSLPATRHRFAANARSPDSWDHHSNPYPQGTYEDGQQSLSRHHCAQ